MLIIIPNNYLKSRVYYGGFHCQDKNIAKERIVTSPVLLYLLFRELTVFIQRQLYLCGIVQVLD